MNVLLACDQFNDSQRQRLAQATAGWATLRVVPLQTPAAEMQAALATTDIVVGWAPAALIAASPVRLYLCGSAGLDAYLGSGLETKAGFRICSAGGVMAIPIAEHLLGLMLALSRELPAILRLQSARQWARRWEAGELHGSAVCLVGLGNSGSALASRCRALGLRVTGVRRNAEQKHPNVDRIYPVARLAEAVADADHVVLTLPGGPGTRRLFDARVFGAMKRGARFYTASRGSVVDEPALIEALRNGHLGGAGLDVFAEEPLPASSPLWSFENVIVSPHSAGLSAHLSDRLCDHFCENLRRFHEGEPLRSEADLARYAAV